MNIQQYNRIKEHFKLDRMIVSPPVNLSNSVNNTNTGPIHEQANRQTRPGYRVPPNVAAFNNYKNMFAGQSVPDDYVPEYIRDERPLPGSQTLNTEYNQDWDPERPFDPYSEGINQIGGYDPSQMDEYMDNFKR